MNTGIFGEGFPYSNFHDLNMDWIIKIAKDFLDQYTSIQDIIAQGETSIQDLTTSGLEQLQEKADNLEALLQEWYNTHSNDIADQLADSLRELNNWYTIHSNDISNDLATALASFNSQATAKAEETIASIPDNYTELSDHVLNIQSELDNYIHLDNKGISENIIGSSEVLEGYYRSGVFTSSAVISSTLIDISSLDIDLVCIDTTQSEHLVGYSFFDNDHVGSDPTGVAINKIVYAPVDRTAKYFYVEWLTADFYKPTVKFKKSLKENINISAYSEIKKGFYNNTVGIGVFYPSDDYTTFVFDNDYNLRVFEVTAKIPASAMSGILYMDENHVVIEKDMLFDGNPNFVKYNCLSNPNAKYIAFGARTEKEDDTLIVTEKDNLILELINENTALDNKYVYSNGSELSNNQFRSKAFNCKPGEKYLYKGMVQTDTFSTYVIFKNSQNTIISYLDTTETGYRERIFTVPANATTMIVNYLNSLGTAKMGLSLIISGEYENNTEYNKMRNAIITINGDSISTKLAGKWPITLEQTQPVNIIANIATGGNKISQISSDTKINAIPIETNILLTDCGDANDFWNNTSTPMGNMATLDDDTTYYGQLNTYFRKLNTRIPNAKIIAMSNQFGYVPDIGITNPLGYTRYDYVKAIKEVCAFNSIEYCPVYEECGINQYNYNTYCLHETDAVTGLDVYVHPNVLGSNMMLAVIERSMKKVLNLV